MNFFVQLVQKGRKMQVHDLKWIRQIKPGDKVYATFQNVDDEIEAVEGQMVVSDNEFITVKCHGISKTFGLWQLLSLLCVEKDLSYIRENSVTSDLDRLANLLG